MENLLVRSVMNVQRSSNPERRDAIPSSNHAYTQRIQRQTSRGAIRAGRRTGRSREVYGFLGDGFDTVQDEIFSRSEPVSSKTIECASSKPYGGFIQAASQLHLLPGSMRLINDADMETSLSWDLVAQVVCLADEPVYCPICLYPPIAPRMERCGHIYCGPCASQYIRYENTGTVKKCAVCSWVFRLEELKRVSIVQVSPVKVGSKLSMVLVEPMASSFKEPTVANNASRALSGLDTFSFVVELKDTQLRLANQNELELLEAFKSSCLEDGDVELLPELNCMMNQLEVALKNDSSSIQAERGSTRAASSLSLVECTGDITEETNTIDSPEHKNPDRSYIYQAADGQLIFLDGLMWKCLLAEYGTVTELPKTLDVTVTSIKTHKMNSVLRKRWRHLKHIPFGHTFHLIEIELDALVSRSTLDQFASALEARSIERDRTRLEDLRLTKLKEAAENRIPSLPEGFRISGHAPLLAGPSFQSSDFVPLGATGEAASKPITSSPSFAEVSRMGALSVVDHNRVANFTRGPLSRRSVPSFNPTNEVWPSLSDVGKQTVVKSTPPRPVASTSSTGFPLSTIVSHDLSRSADKQDCITKSSSKKHRRRRTRTNSLHDS